MLPTNPSFDYATEVDIVEILCGQPETIWMHYHYNNRSSSYRVKLEVDCIRICQQRSSGLPVGCDCSATDCEITSSASPARTHRRPRAPLTDIRDRRSAHSPSE